MSPVTVGNGGSEILTESAPAFYIYEPVTTGPFADVPEGYEPPTAPSTGPFADVPEGYEPPTAPSTGPFADVGRVIFGARQDVAREILQGAGSFEAAVASYRANFFGEPTATMEPVEREFGAGFADSGDPFGPAPPSTGDTGGTVVTEEEPGADPLQVALGALDSLAELIGLERPRRKQLPLGAAGTFAFAGERSPWAILLLLAGLGAVGYYVYRRYYRKRE